MTTKQNRYVVSFTHHYVNGDIAGQDVRHVWAYTAADAEHFVARGSAKVMDVAAYRKAEHGPWKACR